MHGITTPLPQAQKEMCWPSFLTVEGNNTMSDTKLEKEVQLRSVGYMLDTEIAVLYPTWEWNDVPDMDNPCTLEDMAIEWWDSLSVEDSEVVQQVQQRYTGASPRQCAELRRLLDESSDLIDSLAKRLPDLYTEGSTTDVLHKECKLLIDKIYKVKFFYNS